MPGPLLATGAGLGTGFYLFGPQAAELVIERDSEVNSPTVERSRTTRGKLQAQNLMDQMRQEAKLNRLILNDKDL